MYNYNENQTLFNSGRLYDHLRELKNKISVDIDNMSADKFRANSDEEAVSYYRDNYSITPLTLDSDNKIGEPSETTVDVSHDPMKNPFGNSRCTTKCIKLKVTIPYYGDYCLWDLRPDSYSLSHSSRQKTFTPPKENMPGNLIICFEYIQDQASSKQINNDITNEISLIQTNIDAQKMQITQYNNGLEKIIMQCIEKRKSTLRRRNIILDGLNIPLKSKTGMPDIEPIQVKKRIVHLQSKTTQLTSISEPGISEKIFNDILAILRFMGRTFEETAKTFAKLEEEDLRNVFLAALNGYFEGEASGEIFRNNGRADICIKEKNKAAFVAECKIWHGQKSAASALDQLFRYLTWRDCKVSIIIFNKETTSFSKILADLPNAIRDHPSFEKELAKPQYDGEWRFVIKHKDDAERKIVLHVFAFNL